jgi:VWFA-related protein
MFCRSTLTHFAWIVSVTAASTGSWLAGRTPSSQAPAATIRSETRAVVVDVVVTNGANEPVGGLRKEDFEINEDGRPQAVVFFEEHRQPVAPPFALTPMPPNVFTNVPQVAPGETVNVLLIDGLNTPRWDQTYVRSQVIAFLKSMPQGSPLAVFTLGDKLRLIHGFSGDRAALLSSLEDKKSGLWPQWTEVSRVEQDNIEDGEQLNKMKMMKDGQAGIDATAAEQQAYKGYEAVDRAEMTAEALQNLARYLAQIPGRKNLIWFASNFPIGFFPNVRASGLVTSARGHTAPRSSESPSPLGAEQVAELKETSDLLTLSRIAIYPVGAQGVEHRESTDASNPGLVLANGTPEEMEQSDANLYAMAELASETGGESIRNTNDLSGATARAIQNGSHYYTLSYTPTNAATDGQFRSIQVKLAEGKYKLSYRQGYYAFDSAGAPPNAKARARTVAETSSQSAAHPGARSEESSNPLQTLMVHGAPNSSQVLYAVRAEPSNPQTTARMDREGANGKLTGPVTRYTVDFLVDSKTLDLEPAADGNRHGTVQIELLSYDRDGKALNWNGSKANLDLKPVSYDAVRKSGLRAQLQIDVPKGETYLATGVYDWKTGKAGTLEIPLNSGRAESTAKPSN